MFHNIYIYIYICDHNVKAYKRITYDNKLYIKSHPFQNWHWKYSFVPEVWGHVMNKMTLEELHPDKSNNKWSYFNYCMLK